MPNGQAIGIDTNSSELLGKWLMDIFANMHWNRTIIPMDYKIRIYADESQ